MNEKPDKALMPFYEIYLRVVNGTLTLILIGFFLLPTLLLKFIKQEEPSLIFQAVAFLLMLATASALGATVAKRLSFMLHLPLFLALLVLSIVFYETPDTGKLLAVALLLPAFIYIPYRRIAKKVENEPHR
jgi:hypothetical protein